MRTERRHQQRAEARHGEDGIGAGLEAVVAQHQHARHVLAGQRDDEEGKRDAEQRGHREGGGREYRHGQLQRHAAETDLPHSKQERDTGDQHADNRVARGEPAQQGVGENQPADEQGVHTRTAKGADAEAQQNAGEQPGGDAGRNHFHDPLEIARRPSTMKPMADSM